LESLIQNPQPDHFASTAPDGRIESPVAPAGIWLLCAPARSNKITAMKIAAALLAAFVIAACNASAETGVPKDYPLNKCPISGKAYGSGGMKAYKMTHEGTDVWLCCKSCKDDFEKDPAKYAKMVKDAAKK
jgi:YHS domain-containing protein/predicted small secreted protein